MTTMNTTCNSIKHYHQCIYQNDRVHSKFDPSGFRFSSTASPPLAPFLSTTTNAPLVSSTPIAKLAGTKT